jgi:hypothetical protein
LSRKLAQQAVGRSTAPPSIGDSLSQKPRARIGLDWRRQVEDPMADCSGDA